MESMLIINNLKKIILKKYFGIWIAEESVDDCATVSLIMIVSFYELHKIMALYSCMLWTLSSWLCKSMYHVYTYTWDVRSCQFKFVTVMQTWVFELYLHPLMKTLLYVPIMWNKINK